jgi:hypothetical protein
LAGPFGIEVDRGGHDHGVVDMVGGPVLVVTHFGDRAPGQVSSHVRGEAVDHGGDHASELILDDWLGFDPYEERVAGVGLLELVAHRRSFCPVVLACGVLRRRPELVGGGVRQQCCRAKLEDQVVQQDVHRLRFDQLGPGAGIGESLPVGYGAVKQDDDLVAVVDGIGC